MMGKQKFKISPRDMWKIKVIRAKNKLNRAKHMKIWPNLRIQVGKSHPNLMKICEHDLMSMGNKPITLDWKNNVKKWAKTSISTIKLSICSNNSKSMHQIKKPRSYLESGHQNTSSYVVKSQKSIFDMHKWEKYTNTHKNFISHKQARERSSCKHWRVPLESFPHVTRPSDHFPLLIRWSSSVGLLPGEARGYFWDRYNVSEPSSSLVEPSSHTWYSGP